MFRSRSTSAGDFERYVSKMLVPRYKSMGDSGFVCDVLKETDEKFEHYLAMTVPQTTIKGT